MRVTIYTTFLRVTSTDWIRCGSLWLILLRVSFEFVSISFFTFVGGSTSFGIRARLWSEELHVVFPSRSRALSTWSAKQRICDVDFDNFSVSGARGWPFSFVFYLGGDENPFVEVSNDDEAQWRTHQTSSCSFIGDKCGHSVVRREDTSRIVLQLAPHDRKGIRVWGHPGTQASQSSGASTLQVH